MELSNEQKIEAYDRQQQYRRDYYEKNKAKIDKYRKEYNKKNRDKLHEYYEQRKNEHKIVYNSEKAKHYYQNNKGRFKKYYEENRDKILHNAKLRKARKKMMEEIKLMVEIHESLKAIADLRKNKFKKIESDLNKC